MSIWRAILREPLVHFVLLGGVLFAIDYARAPAAPPAQPRTAVTIDRRIVVDNEVTERAKERAAKRLGRTPTAQDVAEETDRWIDEEILFREALARGLERDDPMIRERIASRMSFVLAESVVVPEPTDAQLRAWFDAHRDRYAAPERIDFTHVFLATADDARAREIETQLAAGTSPDTLGDTFSGGRKYRGRKLADLAQAFGPEFVDGLATQPPSKWIRRSSRHGLHLVRIDKVEAPRGPDFETAKLEVRREWMEEQRRVSGEGALKTLRERWQIAR